MVDTNSHYFLTKFKRRSAHGTLKVLRRDDGTLLTSQTDITKEVYSFYERLYRQPEEGSDVLNDRDDMLRLLGPVISPGEQLFLDNPPSYREFSDVLYSSPKGKAPGMDGFSYEALRKIWPDVGEDFTATMHSSWETGSFPASTLEGGLSDGAFDRVQVNSSFTPEFPICRGMRQGCPLAPLLFAVSTIPFILHAQENAKKGKFVTAELPGGMRLDVAALADNTAAFLAVHEPTFREFLRLLEVFQSASGAKINFAKSKILLLGKYSRPHDWLTAGPFKVLGKYFPVPSNALCPV
ncbi:hypothetical protein R1sor_007988 [Riccia sorocarpa]|uniref:Reverse transcriptase domain-containing protein n=1 Tax=Riccia sorocarpa TaxID=122646 RepID=A0ABD3HS30_9MARC